MAQISPKMKTLLENDDNFNLSSTKLLLQSNQIC